MNDKEQDLANLYTRLTKAHKDLLEIYGIQMREIKSSLNTILWLLILFYIPLIIHLIFK
jgi:hypothetical protein